MKPEILVQLIHDLQEKVMQQRAVIAGLQQQLQAAKAPEKTEATA